MVGSVEVRCPEHWPCPWASWGTHRQDDPEVLWQTSWWGLQAFSRICVPVMPYKGDILQWSCSSCPLQSLVLDLFCPSAVLGLLHWTPIFHKASLVWEWLNHYSLPEKMFEDCIPPCWWCHFYLYFLIKQTEGYYLWCKPHIVYIFIIGSLIWFLIIIYSIMCAP